MRICQGTAASARLVGDSTPRPASLQGTAWLKARLRRSEAPLSRRSRCSPDAISGITVKVASVDSGITVTISVSFSSSSGVSVTMLGNHSDVRAKTSGITVTILGGYGDDLASLYRFL